MTEVDLSRNPALAYLNFSNNNLTEIDLSRNAQLEFLILSNNYLTSIDLSRCPYIVVLDLSQNDLRELDLSKNPELMSGNVFLDQRPIRLDATIDGQYDLSELLAGINIARFLGWRNATVPT